MHGAPALLRRLDADQQLLERGLRLDDDGVRAGLHQSRGLFFERAAHLVFGEFAEGLQQAAERADVAEHVAVSVAKGLRARSPRPPC